MAGSGPGRGTRYVHCTFPSLHPLNVFRLGGVSHRMEAPLALVGIGLKGQVSAAAVYSRCHGGSGEWW